MKEGEEKPDNEEITTIIEELIATEDQPCICVINHNSD